MPRPRGHHEDHGGEPRLRRSCSTSGRGWHAIAPPMREGLRALRRARQQGRARAGLQGHRRAVAVEVRHAARTTSPRSSTGSGSRSSRSTSRSTPTCAGSCARSTARRRAGRRARSPRTCSATCGRRTGTNIYPLVAPARTPIPGYDLTRDPEGREDRREADGPLRRAASSPRSASLRCRKTFWERSLFIKPQDRDVVCHASAWDVDDVDDLRIKMCIEITDEDFTTIHHELGHNFYQRAYNKQPPPLPRQRQRRLPRGHRRHHRAVGHARVPGAAGPARQGAGRVQGHRPPARRGPWTRSRSCPSACSIDQWRWKVFSGEITPGRLQRGVVGAAAASTRASRRPWRAARRTSTPAPSTTSPANVPYTRYFLARHPAVPVPPRALQDGRLHRAR